METPNLKPSTSNLQPQTSKNMSTIKYKVYKCTSGAGKKGLYYGRATYDETIDLEALAKHMSQHNTPYSQGTIHGVLKDMVSCIRELLLDSKKVKLDDLAIFSIGLVTTGALTAGDFTASSNISKAHINSIGTGEFSKKQLDLDCKFQEDDKYAVE